MDEFGAKGVVSYCRGVSVFVLFFLFFFLDMLNG